MEAEDVIYKLQASFVVIRGSEAGNREGAIEVKVVFLVDEACVVIEEFIEFIDVVGSMRAVFCHPPLIFLFIIHPKTQKNKNKREALPLSSLIFFIIFLIKTMSDNISFSSNRSSIQKYKIVLVGDQNVGKSSIIARYIRNEFDPTKNVKVV